MRLIKDTICIIIILLACFVFYKNHEKVNNFFKYLFNKNKGVIIKEANEYKRSYNYEVFTIEEDYIPENKEDILNIYYNVFNNGWKNFTFYCPDEYEKCIDDVNEISIDSTLLSNINGYVSPFNSFRTVDTTTTSLKEVSIIVKKNYSEEEINQINNKINEISTNLNLNNITNEEKIRVIHNYIINNTKYDSKLVEEDKNDHSSYKAYGTLIHGYAVCSGYSDALALFLDKYSIPNIKVSSENHVWNLVYINNEWVHVDLTWDDNDYSKLPKKNFLLITTQRLKELDVDEHTFDTSFFVEAN